MSEYITICEAYRHLPSKFNAVINFSFMILSCYFVDCYVCFLNAEFVDMTVLKLVQSRHSLSKTSK